MELNKAVRVLALCLAGIFFPMAGWADERPLGTSVEGLLEYARNNPEYAAMRYEAEAAAQRVYPAGALPDPMFRMELQNVTNAGAGARPEQRTILFPSESVCNLPMEVREQRRRQFLRK